MNKVIVAGSRSISDFFLVEDAVLSCVGADNDVEIISGGARGVDLIGEDVVRKHGWKIKCFPAEWELYGKSAGPIRNKQMAEYAAPDGVLIAVWDGNSPGTRNMIQCAEKFGLEVRVVNSGALNKELDGFEPSGFRGDFSIYRKIVDGKGVWKAERDGEVRDITYQQALGNEPIEETMSSFLGRRLLTHR